MSRKISSKKIESHKENSYEVRKEIFMEKVWKVPKCKVETE